MGKNRTKQRWWTKSLAPLLMLNLLLAPALPAMAASKDFTEESRFRAIAVLPMRVVNNRIHILFEVNGVNVEMLLDTGASATVFFENKTLKPEHFALRDSVEVSFPAFRASATGFRLPTVTLTSGTYEFSTDNALFINEDEEVSDQLASKIDGILGRDFFEAHIVQIDPVAETVTLVKNGTKIGFGYRHRHAIHMDGGTPYIIHRSKLPWEAIKTQKKLLLDTGYPGGIVYWDQKQFLQATSSQEREALEAQNKGVLYFGLVRFGRLIFRNIPIFISPDAPQKVDDRDGIIGATMFRPFRYAIDFNRNALWLDPITKSYGIGYQISNTVVYTPGNEEFIVKKFATRPHMGAITTLVNDKFAIPEN
ncbi:MAG: hypothetical protein HWE25_15615 [Alphaproteobacteria bacterium]|nr:hypothetical protein [Alphaproteobacteria bacterium]